MDKEGIPRRGEDARNLTKGELKVEVALVVVDPIVSSESHEGRIER